jgi:hypothetical protein
MNELILTFNATAKFLKPHSRQRHGVRRQAERDAAFDRGRCWRFVVCYSMFSPVPKAVSPPPHSTMLRVIPSGSVRSKPIKSRRSINAADFQPFNPHGLVLA